MMAITFEKNSFFDSVCDAISRGALKNSSVAFVLAIFLSLDAFTAVAGQVNVAPSYGAPYYTTDFYPAGSCSNAYTSAQSPYSIVSQWWINYQPCWITGTSRQCSYKLGLRADFQSSGIWGGAALTGDCGGGSTIYGTLSCPTGYQLSGSQCVPNGSPIPAKNKGPQCANSVENPINAGNGNKYQLETDIAGQDNLLNFTRTYNSIVDDQPGIMGGYWRNNFERQVITVNRSGISSAIVRRADGRSFYFTLSGSQWISDSDNADVLLSASPSGWQYNVAQDNSIESYDASGKLKTIIRNTGYAQTLTYTDGTTGANGGFVLDANGNPTSATLPAGLLLRVVDSFGRVLAFGYDGNSHLVKLLDAQNQTYLYSYDLLGNLLSVKYPDSKVRTYVYNEAVNTANSNQPNALTGIIDENGQRFATYKYDVQGRATSTEHAGGVNKATIAYTTDANGNVTSSQVTDGLNTARTYSFTNALGVVKNAGMSQPCNSSCGAASATTYDANGNIASRTDFNGNVTNYVYDLTRNLETSRTEAYGTPQARTITTQWSSTYRLPTLITEPGKTTSFSYDASGNLLSKTITDTALNKSRIWTYTYNALGQVLTADGPRTDVSDVTTYTYYSSASNVAGSVHSIGDLATVTNAAGLVTSITNYDLNGRPLSITDPNGVVTTLTYTPRGWLKTRTVNGVQTTTYDYDGVGQLIKATLPDGSYVQYTYDTAHRLTDVTDNAGNKIHYTLDAMGNRTKEDTKDPSSNILKTRSRVFDALNRLQQDIGGTSPSTQITQYGYDNNGNLKTITDPLNHLTTNGYDALNRLITVTDPANGVSNTTYNALDQVTQVKDPRLVATNYTINALGDVTLTQSPDSGNINRVYDLAGNVIQKTDARGVVSNYTYDALNRVTSITYPASTAENVSFTYDSTANGNYGKGKLTGYSNDGGATVLTYDAYGNITLQTEMIGSQIYTTAYQYDNANRVSQITYPSGRIVLYTRNALGQITQVQTKDTATSALTTLISNATYEPFGPLKTVAFGNGVNTTYQHDADYRISRITVTSTPNWDFQYSYDAAGNVIGITDQVSTNSKTFGYDNLNRVTSDTNNTGNWTYQYDANGNRTKRIWVNTSNSTNTQTIGYAATSNRITSPVQGYDPAGNITANGTKNYTFNNANRLSSYSAGTTLKAQYQYNALGQRTIRGVKPQHLHYDLRGHYLDASLLYSNGTPYQRNEYIYLDDMPIAQVSTKYNGTTVTGRRTLFVHADHLNTPRAASDSTQKLVWRWDGDAYGQTTPNQNPDGDSAIDGIDLRLPGQIYDTESGLYYNINRDYDATTGRYLESDPIGLSGGSNTYAYVGNRPVTFTDPSGLCIEDACIIEGAALGAAIQGIINLGGAAAINGMFSGIWGDGTADHPSHHDENDALNITGASSCEDIAWAIDVLKNAIDWRRGDLRPEDSRNEIGRGHRIRIKLLEDKLRELQQAYNTKCKPKCEK